MGSEEEQKRRALALFYQSQIQYAWAIHALEIAHHKWMLQAKKKYIISLAKIIVGGIVVSVSILAGLVCLLAIIT